MRSYLLLPIVVVAVGCAPEVSADPSGQSDAFEAVSVTGTVSDNLDADVMIEDFYASGAMYGIAVDPATGDSLTFQNLDRTVNSGIYQQLAGSCPDCNVGCVGPNDRSIRFDFLDFGSVGVATGFGFQTISQFNYSFSMSNCAINGVGFNGGTTDTCPNTGVSPAGAQNAVQHYGTMTTCAPFSYFFDTTDGL